jgi:hypothetical protein
MASPAQPYPYFVATVTPAAQSSVMMATLSMEMDAAEPAPSKHPHAETGPLREANSAMMETLTRGMAVAAPATLRADTIAQRLVPLAALITTITARVTTVNTPAAMAQFQDLKAAMMVTPPLAMVAAAPAKPRADTTAQRLVLLAALIATLTTCVTAQNHTAETATSRPGKRATTAPTAIHATDATVRAALPSH